MNKYKLTEHFEELKKCPYCSSEDMHLILTAPDRLTNKLGVFYLSKCHKCGLVFQNPRIKEKFIKDYYSKELKYYHPINNKKEAGVLKKIKQWLYEATLINHRNYINLGIQNLLAKIITIPFKNFTKIQLIPDFVPNGKLLEIGCSHGGKLKLLQQYGWNVEGIEMDEKCTKYAQAEHSLRVQNINLKDAIFQSGYFDVIIMSMVLEHLYEPFNQLKKILKWLKPGGQLLISIPYFGGFEFYFFKDCAYGLQLPTHVTFFTKRIIKDFCRQQNCNKIKFYFQYTPRDITASFYYKWKTTKKIIYKIFADNKLIRKILLNPFVIILSIIHRTSRVSIHISK